MQNPFSLENKTILVLGASSGIGQACALQFAKSGAKIIAHGKTQSKLDNTMQILSNEGNNHKSICSDISTLDGILNIINQIDKVDGVVFSTGVALADLIPFKFIKDEDVLEMININLTSNILFSKHLTKQNKINRNGSLVYISSIAALTAVNSNSIYAATKAGISVFVKYLANELAIKKIRVNSISPGMVETPMTKPFMIDKKDLYEEDLKKYPLKRYGKAEEVAYAAQYFLSDASAWTTGINLTIDGGVTSKK